MPFAKSIRRPLLLALFGSAAMMAVPSPAIAGTGCNGVVNFFVWYCAPWDTNNGPQFPYYTKRQVSVPAKQVRIVVRDGAHMALINGQYYPLVGQDGASIGIWVCN